MKKVEKMKKIFVLAAIVCLTAPIYAKPAADTAGGNSELDKVSYAWGIALGSQFKDAGLTFNYGDLAKGFKDILEGNAVLSEDEAISLVQNAYAAALSQKAQENKAKEEQFLAENRTKDGVIVTESGLQYKVISETDGAKPLPTDTVQVNYEGRLIDGAIFDSSADRGSPSEFSLSEVIDGWSEGLQLMSVGSKYQLFVPSSLAYGENGAGSIIPSYATLIFEVELIAIVDDAEED
jgi:FKBP-type peptidyl-prolyl cis-trans isomerase